MGAFTRAWGGWMALAPWEQLGSLYLLPQFPQLRPGGGVPALRPTTSSEAGVPWGCRCGIWHGVSTAVESLELAPGVSSCTRDGDAGVVAKLPVHRPGQRGSG